METKTGGVDRNLFKYNGPGTGNTGKITEHSFNPSTVGNDLNSQRASGMPLVGSETRNLAVVSTNIEVYSNGMRIGFIQSFSPNEQRTITPIQELGTEGVVQMVAGNTNGGSISVSRFAIYNANLFHALGLTDSGQHSDKSGISNPFRTLKDQRVPLEIIVKTNCGHITTYEKYIDCWLTNYSKSIASSTVTINESCTISYSDVMYTENTN